MDQLRIEYLFCTERWRGPVSAIRNENKGCAMKLLMDFGRAVEETTGA
jgi:hypothetical protein